MELALHIKLDVELTARRLLPAAMFGGTASDELIETTRQEVTRGMQAVSQLMVCKPYAAGETFGIADLYTYYSMGLATAISQKMFNADLLADYPQISELMAMLATRPSIARVTEEAAAKSRLPAAGAVISTLRLCSRSRRPRLNCCSAFDRGPLAEQRPARIRYRP